MYSIAFLLTSSGLYSVRSVLDALQNPVPSQLLVATILPHKHRLKVENKAPTASNIIIVVHVLSFGTLASLLVLWLVGWTIGRSGLTDGSLVYLYNLRYTCMCVCEYSIVYYTPYTYDLKRISIYLICRILYIPYKSKSV